VTQAIFSFLTVLQEEESCRKEKKYYHSEKVVEVKCEPGKAAERGHGVPMGIVVFPFHLAMLALAAASHRCCPRHAAGGGGLARPPRLHERSHRSTSVLRIPHLILIPPHLILHTTRILVVLDRRAPPVPPPTSVLVLIR
jgi:hypothetical protein